VGIRYGFWHGKEVKLWGKSPHGVEEFFLSFYEREL
jgi:hypothetical protein